MAKSLKDFKQYQLCHLVLKLLLNSKLILLAMTCLSGCDPALHLTIKAAKRPNVSVSVYGNTRPISDSSNTGVIHVPTNDQPPKYKQTFYYGMGFWSKDAYSIFSKRIDSIVIVNRSSTLRLKDSTEIVTYLRKRLSRLSNTVTIKAK